MDLEDVKTWNSSILPAKIAAYEPSGILTLILPNKSLVLQCENFHGAEHSENYLTVSVWANMDDCKELPLLIASLGQKPQCFMHVKSLPCKYTSNKFPWMTCAVPEDYLRTLGLEMEGKENVVQ
jgi:hypothetical protein